MHTSKNSHKNFSISIMSQVLEKVRDRWQHVLVDEWQDINAMQYCLVRMLAGEQGSLFAVGDQVRSARLQA